MAQQRKIIITCAVTGGIHTPTMSPHLATVRATIRSADPIARSSSTLLRNTSKRHALSSSI
jgi:hypothetical protein